MKELVKELLRRKRGYVSSGTAVVFIAVRGLLWLESVCVCGREGGLRG